MLINNGIRFGGGPHRSMGGASGGAIERGRWSTPGALRNFYAGEATVISAASIANKNAFPGGYRHPHTWVMATKNGGLAARRVSGVGTATATLINGQNLSSDIDGIGTLDADGSLVLEGAITITAEGTLLADIVGVLEGYVSVIGEATVTADIAGIFLASADLTGTGTLTAEYVPLPGNLACSIIINYTATIDAAELADQLWGYLIEGGYSAADLQRIMSAVLAGKCSGGPGSPVYRDVNDTVNRVSGTADVSGNRSVVTLNP